MYMSRDFGIFLYKGKYSPLFYFCPFRPRCQHANLKPSEFKRIFLITVFIIESFYYLMCPGEFKKARNREV